MSTEEKEREIGRAFLERKEASQTLKCLSLKLRRMHQSLDFASRASASIELFSGLSEVDMLADYPSRDELLALSSEIRSVQIEIEHLDRELD